MKFFRMSPEDATKAKDTVWQAQCILNQPLMSFKEASVGTDTMLWTADQQGEAELRRTLQILNIPFQES